MSMMYWLLLWPLIGAVNMLHYCVYIMKKITLEDIVLSLPLSLLLGPITLFVFRDEYADITLWEKK
jgi:uncharacterized membrane protein